MERTLKVYCAGPLFTSKEQEEMQFIAMAIEELGYSTFLPQRDGLELSKCVESLVARGLSEEESGLLTSRAIFALDVYQVLYGCDALVANLNGRVPDEGTVAEAAMAWSRGKLVIGYKADCRSPFGGQDNPLLAGLFHFELYKSVDEAVLTLHREMKKTRSVFPLPESREAEIDSLVELGTQLTEVLDGQHSLDEVVEIIVEFRGTVSLA